MVFKNRFSSLGAPNRIWTVSAIHGQQDRLTEIHRAVHDRFAPGDRLVYTGNYLCGEHARPLACIDELLFFRRTLLALPGILPEDFVYLRGVQEELWRKILQITFAAAPRAVIDWIAQRHPEMDAVLRAYGSSLDEAARVSREGVMSMTKWVDFLRRQAREQPGHEIFFSIQRRAAFTDNPRADNDNNLLFVNTGLNPDKPLTEQGDSFWWDSRRFSTLDKPYAPFKSVVRGFDPESGGVRVGSVSITLDGGCGRGGQLVCATLSGTGDVLDMVAA